MLLYKNRFVSWSWSMPICEVFNISVTFMKSDLLTIGKGHGFVVDILSMALGSKILSVNLTGFSESIDVSVLKNLLCIIP